MARYDTRVAAAALDVPEAWLSSLLTRFPIVGVIRRRQGFRRQLSVDAVVCVAIARSLIVDLGVAAESAVVLAHELMTAPGGMLTRGRGHAQLSFDLPGKRRQVRAALDDAVSGAAEIRRGRPRSRRLPRD